MSTDSGKDIRCRLVYKDAYDKHVPIGFAIPAQHPRVYFTQEHIDQRIKPNLLKDQNASAYASFMSYAENTEQTGILEDGTYKDDPMKCVEAKAFYYALYKNDSDEEMVRDAWEKGKRAIEILCNIIKTMNVSKFNYNTAGQTIFMIGVVYDWCNELMDPETKELFHEGVLLCGPRLDTGYPPTKESSVHSHGCESNVFRDLMVAGLAMYDEEEYRHIWYNTAGRFFSEYIEPRKFFNAAHMHTQGSHYSNYRYQWEILCTRIFDVLGIPDIFGKEQELVMMNYLYPRRADGLMFVDGDSSQNGRDKGCYYTQARSMFHAANYYGNAYLKYEAMRSLDKMGPETEKWKGNQGLGAVEILIFNDPDLEGKPYDDLPLSWYQPSPKGGMVARTEWTDGFDSPAAVVEMKINEYFTGSHQHLDAGAFQIYYKGILATDDGYYQAYWSNDPTENNGGTQWGSVHWEAYYRRSIAHNVMHVLDPNELVTYEEAPKGFDLNDGGQRQPKDIYGRGVLNFEEFTEEYRTGKVLGQEYGTDPYVPDYTYLKGDLSYAYTDKVEEYERSFMFLNLKDKDHPAALLVFDRLVSADATFKKSWLCHGLYEPTIEHNSDLSIRSTFVNSQVCMGEDKYNGKMTIDTLLPTRAEVKKVKGHIGAQGIDYYGQELSGERYVNEGKGWRIEVSPGTQNKEDIFLNVIQMSDADGIDPLPVALLESGDHTGAIIADRVVLFGKCRDRKKQDVLFGFEGDRRSYKITVADLKEGLWKVEKDGEYLCDVIVTAQGGVAAFEGGAGQYSIQYMTNQKKEKEYDSVKPVIGEGYTIRVNKRFVYNKVAPICINNCILASMEFICKKIHAKYEWDEKKKNLVMMRGEEKVCFTEGMAHVHVNGEEKTIDAAPVWKDGTLMVPVMFAAQHLGCDVDYDPFSKTVNIIS